MKQIIPTRQATFIACVILSGASFSVRAAPPTDVDVTNAIEQQYTRDDLVPFNRISVLTHNGIVTLRGTVTNLAARNEAERRASIVRGVRSVINEIDVETTRTPAEITRDAQAELRTDPATHAYDVTVQTTDDGTVVLTGKVSSWAERKLAQEVASTAPGVTAVDNRVTIDDKTNYGDIGELAETIRGRLRWDARVNDALIHVLVLEGNRVMISGTVGSLAEKKLAAELAHVPGVRSVDVSHLDVEPWAKEADLRRGEYHPKSDEDIQKALSQALAYDPRVPSKDVNVDVAGNAAWLNGTVDNLLAKRAAQRDAYNTLGIERVYNYVKVQGHTVTDDALRDLVTNALRGRGLLEHNDIDVDVNGGRVRLTGDVANSYDYWQADVAASRTRGVEELQDDLTIRGRTPVAARYPYGGHPTTYYRPDHYSALSDREIYQDVRSELFWTPFVDADAINVAVDNGVVTLTGTVGSRRERYLAANDALEGGALVVHNDLTVASN